MVTVCGTVTKGIALLRSGVIDALLSMTRAMGAMYPPFCNKFSPKEERH